MWSMIIWLSTDSTAWVFLLFETNVEHYKYMNYKTHEKKYLIFTALKHKIGYLFLKKVKLYCLIHLAIIERREIDPAFYWQDYYKLIQFYKFNENQHYYSVLYKPKHSFEIMQYQEKRVSLYYCFNMLSWSKATRKLYTFRHTENV